MTIGDIESIESIDIESIEFEDIESIKFENELQRNKKIKERLIEERNKHNVNVLNQYRIRRRKPVATSRTDRAPAQLVILWKKAPDNSGGGEGQGGYPNS